MVHHPGEQPGQLGALCGGQRREQPGLDSGQQLLEPVEVGTAGRGDSHRVAPAVARVR